LRVDNPPQDGILPYNRPSSLLTFCEWLANTPGSIALHESVYVYPVIESIHVLTLCLFLGLAVTLDLRLLGISKRQTPVSEVAERLLRIASFCGLGAWGRRLLSDSWLQAYPRGSAYCVDAFEDARVAWSSESQEEEIVDLPGLVQALGAAGERFNFGY
jgi:hypothetical protein